MSEIIKFQVNYKDYKLDLEIIDAVYLFGSIARNDGDEYSDTDFFVLIKNCNDNEYIHYKKEIARQLQVPLDWLSVYRQSKVNIMLDYGSYFLWHLKLEGIKLYDKNDNFETRLSSLRKYSRIEEDLNEYSEIYEDITKSIDRDLLTLSYELNLLASIIRNTSIAISHMNNLYHFGRYTPVEYCIKTYPSVFTFTLDEYRKLYIYRLVYSRSIDIESSLVPSVSLILYWLNIVEKILKLSKNIYNERGVYFGLC